MIPVTRKIRGGQSKQIWGGQSRDIFRGVPVKKSPCTCLLSYIERDDEKKSNRSELAEVLPSLMIAARRSPQRSHRLEYLDYPSDLHPLIHFGYCYSKLYIIYISHRLEYLDFPSFQPALHLFCWDLIHTHFYIIKIIDIPRSEELIGKRKQVFRNPSV